MQSYNTQYKGQQLCIHNIKSTCPTTKFTISQVLIFLVKNTEFIYYETSKLIQGQGSVSALHSTLCQSLTMGHLEWCQPVVVPNCIFKSIFLYFVAQNCIFSYLCCEIFTQKALKIVFQPNFHVLCLFVVLKPVHSLPVLWS